jgi:hypothetical protein
VSYDTGAFPDRARKPFTAGSAGGILAAMERGTARRLGLIGLGLASVVLLGNGVPMVIAAALHVVFGHSLASVGWAVALAPVGVVLSVTAIRLHTGGHGWWRASVGLLPVAAAFQFLDAYLFGDGRVPVVSGVILPTAALACLLLRPATDLASPAVPPVKAESPL